MQGWDQLILDNLLPEESKLWAGWRESQSVAPYIPLSCTFEEFLSRFPGKKRYKLRSKIAKARASGIDFHIARSPQEKALFIQALFDLHNRRSAAIARKSSIKGEYVEKFHHDLVTSTAQACLYALKKGDRFVAVLYGFQERDRFHFYQIAHDPEYDSLRPGTVILAFAVELACDSGLIEFNFLQGDEPYKFEWTTTVRHLTRVEFVSPRLKPKAVALARRSARFAKRIFR